jgi:hypothetical protein
MFLLYTIKFYFSSVYFIIQSRGIAHNVPAVYDVFAVAIKELRSNSSGGQNVPEKKRTKAAGRLRFFVGQARYCGRSIYNPVMRSSAVPHYFLYFYLINHYFLYYYFILLYLYIIFLNYWQNIQRVF